MAREKTIEITAKERIRETVGWVSKNELTKVTIIFP
jgi:hypothetical protein